VAVPGLLTAGTMGRVPSGSLPQLVAKLHTLQQCSRPITLSPHTLTARPRAAASPGRTPGAACNYRRYRRHRRRTRPAPAPRGRCRRSRPRRCGTRTAPAAVGSFGGRSAVSKKDSGGQWWVAFEACVPCNMTPQVQSPFLRFSHAPPVQPVAAHVPHRHRAALVHTHEHLGGPADPPDGEEGGNVP
jgi:hypothetical protein